MDGMVSGIFHNAVETKKDFISLCGVSCDPHTVKREAVSPKLPSCTKPSLAGTRSLDWYMSKASLHDCCGLRFCIEQHTGRQRYIGLLIYYGHGSQEALGQFRWDLTVTEMVLPNQAQYHNNVIQGKHRIRWSLSEAKSDCQNETCWKALPPSGIMFWWFGPHGEQLRIVKADSS
jgi:hypothetical protein